MKNLLYFVFALITPLFWAQSLEIDQLRSQLNRHTRQDVNRVEILNKLAFNLALAPEERAKFANEAIKISNKIGDLPGKAFAITSLALVKGRDGSLQEYAQLIRQADKIATALNSDRFSATLFMVRGMVSEDLQQKLKFLLVAEKLASKSNDLILQSRANYMLANTYVTAFSNFGKGIDYNFRALHLAEKANDPKSLITCWASLGNIYSEIGDRKNAIFYLNKAEEANSHFKDLGIEYLLQNFIGEHHRISGNYQQAIGAYNKGLRVGKILNINSSLNESNLADVYTSMNDLPHAFQYAFSALKGAKEINDVGGEEWIYSILSRAYLKNHDTDSAVKYAKLGLSSAELSGGAGNVRDNLLALSEAFAAKKDYEKAYQNYQLYVKNRDLISNAEVRNRTAVEQFTYNVAKKQAQIKVLSVEKRLQQNLLLGAAGLLVLLGVVAVLLFHNNRQKQKANSRLEGQRNEIKEKAKALSDQKDNVELLNEIGRNITSSLSIETVIGTVYKNVNLLMDARIFGIGIYNPEKQSIEFPSTYRNGKPLPFYSNSIHDQKRFGAVCFRENREIILNDLDHKYKDYRQELGAVGEEEQAQSVIFLPLTLKDRKLGVITVQSFSDQQYSEYQLFMLRNIAIYTAIALDNAESYTELKDTISTLKQTQRQLVQAEKMASLGELTAGIAHEIQNPLNFVNNFSEVSAELIDEMNEELENGELSEAKKIAADVKDNLAKINNHGKRADAIVKAMLQHSRSSKGIFESTDINALCDEYLRLSYHGLRAKNKGFNATILTDFDPGIGKVLIIPQDFGRVILNLLTNAFYAVDEKAKTADNTYEPTVSVSSATRDGKIFIAVSDNGNGISPELQEKIFQPFFTTKPSGKGTGLGLSMSFEIITKGHHGELKVKSKENEGTTFTIIIDSKK
ncbi:ATP-binding protein [Kaistella palustris]|uniref:ATP-binding protein n=1 Tax=Kaistella palustris TaxID=493376 RepID=UPI00041221DB|nr:ATP-binding protein [Kaistella palustris]